MSARLNIQTQNFHFKPYQDYLFTDYYFGRDQQALSLDTMLPHQATDAYKVEYFPENAATI